MVKTAPRKPSGAKESFELPGWVIKGGVGVLAVAVIIGVSQLLSPPAEDAAAAAPAAGKKSGTAVKQLTDATFESFVGSHPDGVMVDFYSKDCKFCVKLAPEFEAAAKELKLTPPLASIDSESGAQMMQKFGINRFPTVLWFWKGENVLELPRASEKPAAKIVEWAQWAVTPAVQELETHAEFGEALATLRSSLHSKARLMVAFNKGDANKGMRDAIEAAAQRHRSTTVFLYIKEGGEGETSSLRAYGPEESKDENYEGATDTAGVVAWVNGILEKVKPTEPAKGTEQAAEAKTAADKAMEQVKTALQNAEEAKKDDKAAHE